MSYNTASDHGVDVTPTLSHYNTIQRLAEGGMGFVEVAMRTHGQFERLYAVKRLHPHLARDENFVAMFFDEARLAALIRHANVVSVLDVGSDERGPFMAMEFVEGVTVREILTASIKAKRPLPLQLTLEIVRQVAAGLHAAHEIKTRWGEVLHLVHRDVSPQNIMVGFDGIVRITDFGIAKAMGRATETMGGVLKGKTGYMSPEQLRFQEVDRRTDLFSLGVVLHELLTGQRLYPGGLAKSVEPVLEEPAINPKLLRPSIPSDVGDLCVQLLEKDRAHRPDSAKEVVGRLSAAQQTMIAEKGLCDLSHFMVEEFAGRRVDLNEAMNRARTAVTVATPSNSLEQSNSMQLPTVSRRLVWGIGAGVLVALALVAAWAVGVSMRSGTPPPVAETEAEPPARGQEPAGATPMPGEPTAEADAEEPPAATSNETDVASPTPEPEVPEPGVDERDADPRRLRHSRRGSRNRPRTPPMMQRAPDTKVVGGVPLASDPGF